MGRVVIACYRPKDGCRDQLRVLMNEHVNILRSQGLVTDRAPILMEAVDGSLVEVFEWLSKDAIKSAHSNPIVLEMWEQHARVCTYIPVADLAESSQLFSEFTPL